MLTMIPPRTWKILAGTLVALVGGVLGLGAGMGMTAAILVSGTAALALIIGARVGEDEEDAVAAPVVTAPIEPPHPLETPPFLSLIEGFADPLLLVERSRIVRANKAALSLLGGHIIGEDVRIAIRHPAVAERLSGDDMLNAPASVEVVGLGARNQRWVMQIIPLRDGMKDGGEDGGEDEMPRLLVHMSDRTGQYASERARVDFVANASHELRTPLAAILGFVETLSDPKAGGDAQTRARFLAIVEGEARRMQQLVDDLMSLSRIEADKHRAPLEGLDIGQLVREVKEIAHHSLGKRGNDIVTAIAPDLPPVQGDRGQLLQLVHNLVGNSAKYGRPGTPIAVRVSPFSANMVRLEVADEGEGIAEEHLPRLTERFYRVDSGRSRSLGGTGLGLAIVKHIVERHRGRLDIASVPGKGTTVSVLLPVVQEAQPETAAGAMAEKPFLS